MGARLRAWHGGAGALHGDVRQVLIPALVLLSASCGRPSASPGAPSRLEVWTEIQPQVARYGLSPGFIYALVAAESNFDPQARNGEARGLLQVKPAAWS